MPSKDVMDALVAWLVVTGFFSYTLYWNTVLQPIPVKR